MERENVERVKVECTQCPFSKTVVNRGEKAAEVITEHGRETGHTLTTEEAAEE